MLRWGRRRVFGKLGRLALVAAIVAPPIAWAQKAAAPAATVSATDAAAERDNAVRWSEHWLDHYLALPKEWELDAELRTAGQAVIDEARPRLKALLRGWADELHAPLLAQPGQTASRREHALLVGLGNRLLNEKALNLLDHEGPTHQAWRSRVATTAGWCRQVDAPAAWAEVLLAIERLPAAERSAALAHERQVLLRWGQARPAQQHLARPAFSLDAYATRLLADVKQGSADKRPPVAMVPVVAATLLRDDAPPLAGSDSVPPPHRGARCAGLQWALANARLQRVAAPAELDNAHRHAFVPRLEDGARVTDGKGPQALALIERGWPLHVARHQIVGPVQVQLRWDAQGRVLEAQVVSRKLSGPGLEGRRPVAFETALDDASLALARNVPANGRSTAIIELVWKLED
jgi:hypothetical protein